MSPGWDCDRLKHPGRAGGCVGWKWRELALGHRMISEVAVLSERSQVPKANHHKMPAAKDLLSDAGGGCGQF